jgi:hypothetical protein
MPYQNIEKTNALTETAYATSSPNKIAHRDAPIMTTQSARQV